ncbi:hypothetical protein JKG47_01865 [Acidithiobacillus sp. MC6.1]|nr:hypothetical protein [Acidithiobacillus sp. MC6.1]
MKSKSWMEGFSDVLEAGSAEAQATLSSAAKAMADGFVRDEDSFLRKKERIKKDIKHGSRLSSSRFTV